MGASRFETLTGGTGLAFGEYDDPPAEPMDLVAGWLAAAAEQGVREPRAMTLATADRAGRCWQRVIAIIAVDADGVLFCTHAGSRKAREMAAVCWASGLLYWRETGQQVIFAGPVRECAPAESERLWDARPVPLHAMSSVSRQSEPLPDPDGLRAQARELELLDRPLPRPPGFVGYRLVPEEVEFWAASDDRMHRRLHYRRTGAGWRTTRLQP
ncbi:phenazine biosynthesis FMN-dependent oxidase PhzG [Actinomadura macrotermitis]|uniref:Phenazine biosynthesis protein PhzG n=1 Tax=Actinomadura macrotermitis TaxID=2585200 RepID=A0A7K0BZ39_9ACTN|nr:phenazine biosynthesis FMN-dependent oxidase PhzG [Actinomadura macrotermitis]MQY06455.1 Phenazine biosynthesis protein PhzG [Actinomadura macrotermitis]